MRNWAYRTVLRTRGRGLWKENLLPRGAGVYHLVAVGLLN